MSCAALFPAIEPFASGHLVTGDGHRLYWERSGNPSGRPLLCLHGGPGSASSPHQRRQFDPARWCITQFDQRACGHSQVVSAGLPEPSPLAWTWRNTTPALLADIERLRRALTVDHWVLAGGSWGATLALAYAGQNPEAVDGLLLRSPFLADAGDMLGLWDTPAPPPAASAAAVAALDRGWREVLLALDSPAEETPAQRLARAWTRLSGDDVRAAHRAALAWHVNERLRQGSRVDADLAEPGWARLFDGVDRTTLWRRACVQCHYLRHGCFVDMTAVLHGLREGGYRWPVRLVGGAEDRLCEPAQLARLAQTLALAPQHAVTVAGVGHEAFAPAMQAAWQAAAADLLQVLDHGLEAWPGAPNGVGA